MDERKKTIRELEEKKIADIEARNRLLEGLGKTLLLRVEEGEQSLFSTEDSGGVVLIEYRRLEKQITEAIERIKTIEAAIRELKALEEAISGKEAEYSQLEKKLGEVYTELGKALFSSLDAGEFAAISRQQEQLLLAKIDEQEEKLEQLEQKEGGIFTWLGKNAQMAVSRAFLAKNRSALEKVYREAGEKFSSGLSEAPVETLQDLEPVSNGAEGPAPSSLSAYEEPEYESLPALPEEAEAVAVEPAREALSLRKSLSSLEEELAGLKEERKKTAGLFGTGNSPYRQIQGLEKNMAVAEGRFPGLYLRFGSLAAESNGEGAFSSLIAADDQQTLERAKLIKVRIAGEELEIEKINALINIDNEKAGIEKAKKGIVNQRQIISAAELAITGLENQIVKSEEHIEKLKAFINSGAQKDDYGGEIKEDGESKKDPGPSDGKKRNSRKGNRG